MTTGERLKHLREIAKDIDILFVEDSDNVRVGTYNILKSFFEKIATAKDGLSGLDVYKYAYEQFKNYEIVITDVNMPQMNGLEMIREIKKLNPTQKTVVISACEDEETIGKAKDLGVDGYIIKPIELVSIIDTFTRILEGES